MGKLEGIFLLEGDVALLLFSWPTVCPVLPDSSLARTPSLGMQAFRSLLVGWGRPPRVPRRERKGATVCCGCPDPSDQTPKCQGL